MSLNFVQDEPILFSAKVATAFTDTGLFVKMTLASPPTCAPAAAGQKPDGILDATAVINDMVSFAMRGVKAVRLGYAGTAGDYVQVGTGGKAVLYVGTGPCAGRLLSGGADTSLASIDLTDRNPAETFPVIGAGVTAATAITPTGRYFAVAGATKVDSLVLTAVPVGVPFTIVATNGFVFAKEAAATTNGADVTLTAGGTITLVKIGTTAVQIGGVPDVVA